MEVNGREEGMEMTNDELMMILSDVEFCDENGNYYRAIAVCKETTGVVVQLERVE